MRGLGIVLFEIKFVYAHSISGMNMRLGVDIWSCRAADVPFPPSSCILPAPNLHTVPIISPLHTLSASKYQ